MRRSVPGWISVTPAMKPCRLCLALLSVSPLYASGQSKAYLLQALAFCDYEQGSPDYPRIQL